MPIIITLIIAIYLIFLSWTWHNLGSIEKSKKVITIIAGIIITFILTLIIFNISKSDVTYFSKGEMEAVRNVLVILFTGINCLIIMPSIAKSFNGIKEKRIEKEDASKKFAITLIVFVVVLIVECGYLKSIQQGIMDIYLKALNK